METKSSYLLHRQRNPLRLKRVAIEEFVACWQTGRLIAVTGSYATSSMGYLSWGELIEKMLDDIFEEETDGVKITKEQEELEKSVKEYSEKQDPRFDNIDVIDLAELLRGIDRHYDTKRFKNSRRIVAEKFLLKGSHSDIRKVHNVTDTLVKKLNIRRFVTLNYDLEIEWSLFLNDYEKNIRSNEQRAGIWKEKAKRWKHKSSFESKSNAAIRRSVPGFGLVQSESLSERDAASLFDFAIGKSGFRAKVLHLHGRADKPKSLIISRRDYRDRYWRAGLSRLPFEYGLQSIFAGNPALFVGIGMKEAEVTRALEQVLSDNPNRRSVPMFILWNTPSDANQSDALRLLFYRKFGVHTLFDKELEELLGKLSDSEDLPIDVEAYEKLFYKSQKDDEAHDQTDNAAKLVETAKSIETVASELKENEQDDFAQKADQAKQLDHAAKSVTEVSSSLQDSTKTKLEGRAKNAQRMDIPAKLLAKTASEVQKFKWKKIYFRDPQLKYENLGLRTPLTLWQQKADAATEAPEFGMAEDGKFLSVIAAKKHLQELEVVKTEAETDEKKAKAEKEYAQAEVALAIAEGASVKAKTFVKECLASGHPILPIIGSPSSRRGALVRVLRNLVEDDSRPDDRIVTVSGAFVTEMDSLFAVLSGAWNNKSAFDEEISRISSIGQLKADIEGTNSKRLIIVIAGMERFIAHDGSSLSNELDMLVRIISKLGTENSDKFRLILVGSPRLMRYLETVAPAACDGAKQLVNIGEHSILLGWTEAATNKAVPALRQQSYFEALSEKNEVSPEQLPSVRDASSKRRHFLAMLTEKLSSESEQDPKVVMEILRTLAFIGQPTEDIVLKHAPSLRRQVSDDKNNVDISKITKALDWLKKKGLVLTLEAYPQTWKKAGDLIGLHKTLISELRQRHGVPLSDARLASGFNVGLFVSQPIDSVIPDQEWHRELSILVDGLIGQFNDEDDTPKFSADFITQHKASIEKELRLHFLSEYNSSELARMACHGQSLCLRAALSVLRSYFSTPSLLMAGNRGFDPWLADGPLTDHAARLTRLIRIYRQGVFLRQKVAILADEKEPDNLEEIKAEIGPPPFYADDLAWLHNELGVVLLTQGRLYEANEALNQAESLNNAYIEFGERHQNWRRISLNRLQVLIDMGRIEEAEELIRDIETAIAADAEILCPAAEACNATGEGDCFRDYVIKYYCSKSEPHRGGRLNSTYTTDLILAQAMVIGYQGLCYHLRGALEAGLTCLTDAVQILSRISEQRAYAFFQKHLAALYGRMGKRDEALSSLQLCTAAAGPSRQTDIDHSGRIALAEYGIVSEPSSKVAPTTEIIPQLRETINYALNSDMYRLQLEAMQIRSLVHLQSGDAETALKFATDALSIACRYGFGLRKISLRILIGKILAVRKELSAAKKMLITASRIATSMRYANAVAVAEDYLVTISDEERER